MLVDSKRTAMAAVSAQQSLTLVEASHRPGQHWGRLAPHLPTAAHGLQSAEWGWGVCVCWGWAPHRAKGHLSLTPLRPEVTHKIRVQPALP